MKILVTGANGYIGKRIIPILLEKGHKVIAMVRMKGITLPSHLKNRVQTITADLLTPKSLEIIPKDIDIVYYLVHSMSDNTNNFFNLEEKAAKNFSNYIKKTKAKQIIYLSGISNNTTLSKHIASRLNVEKVLITSNIPTTT